MGIRVTVIAEIRLIVMVRVSYREMTETLGNIVHCHKPNLNPNPN